jgi:hypothetical protein
MAVIFVAGGDEPVQVLMKIGGERAATKPIWSPLNAK